MQRVAIELIFLCFHPLISELKKAPKIASNCYIKEVVMFGLGGLACTSEIGC